MCNIVISVSCLLLTPLCVSGLGNLLPGGASSFVAHFTHCFVYYAEIESQQRTVAALVSF